MILVAEIIIGLFIFGFEPEFLNYLVLVWGLFHSLFLLADIIDGIRTNDDSFIPIFLFISFLGIFLLGFMGFVWVIMKFNESKYNPFKRIMKLIERFNDWLDRK